MRNIGALDEIEEIEIIAPSNMGAWREKDRFNPIDWNIQILTHKRTRLGLSKIQKLRGGKVLNMSTGGVAYRVYKSIEAVPGDRILVQLDKCNRGSVLVNYNAVIKVVRIFDGAVICARFVNTSWGLINAIESNLKEAY